MTEWSTNTRAGYRSKVVKLGSIEVVLHRPLLDEATERKRQEAVKRVMQVCGHALSGAAERN